MKLLGIDTGGTFTDFVYYNEQGIHIHKVLSTPKQPEKAILKGITDLQIDLSKNPKDFSIIHGSTVGTNAVLERKGVKTVFITNRGLRDLLTIGRQARSELYNLQPKAKPVPVTEEHCLEADCRLAADGSELTALNEEELNRIKKQILDLSPAAVAICLLFSYLDESQEKTIANIIPKDLFVSLSSTVLPEHKEYERGITTWLNAYVGPIIESYLLRLSKALQHTKLSVLQSSGGTIEASMAGQQAVRLLLSGPAGGLAGANYVAKLAGHDRLLTFDMGGTSTDVALIDGDIQLTNQGKIGDFPVAVPMADIHTIGAGGGSIASLDAGKLLHVGPTSAGADPGPACYGRDGNEATVTDANLVLGRLLPDCFLGGKMQLDIQASRRVIKNLADQQQLSIEECALGIVQVINENMVRALRVMSVQRNIAPGTLTLVSFGGAGGLHVCALADALIIRHAMVPVHAGVLSALGMLVAPRARYLSRTINSKLEMFDEKSLAQHFDRLIASGQQSLRKEGVSLDEINITRSLDLCYQGQSYPLIIPWRDIKTTTELFHQQHKKLYGHSLDIPIQLVNLRVNMIKKAVPLTLTGLTQPLQSTSSTSQPTKTTLYAVQKPVIVIARECLTINKKVAGPLLITDKVSTTFVDTEWTCVIDNYGNLQLEH